MKIYLTLILTLANLLSLLLLFLIQHDSKNYIKSQIRIIGEERKDMVKNGALRFLFISYTLVICLLTLLSYLFLAYGSPF